MNTARRAASPLSIASAAAKPPNELPTTALAGPTAVATANAARANSRPELSRPDEAPCPGASNVTTRKPLTSSAPPTSTNRAPRLPHPCTSKTPEPRSPHDHAATRRPPTVRSNRRPPDSHAAIRSLTGRRGGEQNSRAAQRAARRGDARCTAPNAARVNRKAVVIRYGLSWKLTHKRLKRVRSSMYTFPFRYEADAGV